MEYTPGLFDDAGENDPFDEILSNTLGHEGGFTVDHAGPTNQGITQSTFDRYRKSMDLEPRDVKTIREDEVYDIYRSDFYETPKINKLPPKVQGVVFDFGVNSSPDRAIKTLQRTVGATPDGDIGPKTIEAVNAYVEKNGEDGLVNAVINKREGFLKQLIQDKPEKYKKFENGWKNRLKKLREQYGKLTDSLDPFGSPAYADEITDEQRDYTPNLFDEETTQEATPNLFDEEKGFTPGLFEEQEKKGARPAVEVVKGGLRGLQGIVAGTGGLIDMAGQNIQREADKMLFVNIPDVSNEERSKKSESLRKIGLKVSEWGKTAKDFWTKASQEGIAAPDPEMFTGSFMQNPSWTRGVTIVAEAVPSLGAATAASIAAGGNPMVGLAFLGSIEGEQTFAEARSAGKSVDDANMFFGMSALGTSVLEALPLTRFLRGGEGKVVKDAFIGAVQEGGEEGLQNLWQNVIARIGYDKTRSLTEGMVESVIGGAGSGGVMGGLTSGRAKKLDKEIKQAVDAGVPQVAIDAMQETVANQIVNNADAVEQAITDVGTKKTVDVNVTSEMEGAKESGLPVIEVKPEIEAVLEKSNISEERRSKIIELLETPEKPTDTGTQSEIVSEPETKPTVSTEAKGEEQTPPVISEEAASAEPIRPPSERWSGDRGAIPNEPSLILDENEETGEGSAAIFENEQGKFYARKKDGSFIKNPKNGNQFFDDVNSAASEAEKLYPPKAEEVKPQDFKTAELPQEKSKGHVAYVSDSSGTASEIISYVPEGSSDPVLGVAHGSKAIDLQTGNRLGKRPMGMKDTPENRKKAIEIFGGEVIKQSRPEDFATADEYVESKGKALLHATSADFESFDVSKSIDGAIWVTPQKDLAEAFRRGFEKARGVGKIIDAYVDLKNPLTIEELGADKDSVIAKAKADGHDGIILKNKDGEVLSMAVFNNEAIKTKSQLTSEWQAAQKKPIQKQGEAKPIKATSKSVRDNTQSVTIDKGKITVTSRSGSNKIGSYTFDLKKWEELDKSFGNPNFNKKEFIKQMNEEAIPGNYTEDRVGEPFVERIEDAQISAINDAFKQYKASKVGSVEVVSKKELDAFIKAGEKKTGAVDVEKELKDALDDRRKEIANLRKKANKSRSDGKEEMAQIYEGQIRDYMSVDEAEFKKDFRANPDYYIKSNIDPFLRFKNKEVNRADPNDKRSIQEIRDDAKQAQPEAKKEAWEMTRDEYVKAVEVGQSKNYTGPLKLKQHIQMVTSAAKTNHKFYVKEAISEGKPVPAEVLAEYPELKPEVKEQKAETKTPGFYIRDTLVMPDMLSKVAPENAKRILEIKDEFSKLGYIDARTELGPDQSRRMSQGQRDKMNAVRIKATALEDEVRQLLKTPEQVAKEAKSEILSDIDKKIARLENRKRQIEDFLSEKLRSPRPNSTKTEYASVIKDIEDAKAERVKAEGNWRDKVNSTQDIFVKGDMLRAIADAKSAKDSDLIDVISMAKGLSEEGNILWAVSKNPSASEDTKKIALDQYNKVFESKELPDEEIQRGEQAESVSGRTLPVEEGGTDSGAEYRIVETEEGLELFEKDLYKKDPVAGKMHEKQIESARKVLAMSVDEIYDLETKDGGMEFLEEAGIGIYSLKDYTEEQLETIDSLTDEITIGKRSIIDEMVAFKIFESQDIPVKDMDEKTFLALYGADAYDKSFGHGIFDVNIRTATPSYFVHDQHFFNLLDAVRDKFPKITALNLPQAVKELKKFKSPIDIFKKIKSLPVATKSVKEKAVIEDEKLLKDFGEKIGGARKDTAERGFQKTTVKKDKTGPAEVLAEYPELKPGVKEQKTEEPVETEWEATKRKVAEMQARLEKEKADKKPLQSIAESAILKSEGKVLNGDATGSRAVSEQPATGEPVGDRGRALEPSRAVKEGTILDDKGVAGSGEEGTGEVSPSDPIQNYRISDADELGVGGLKTKFKQNISAIKLLKKIEEENRPATKEEQSVLVKYVGWGGMSQAFDRWNDQWGKEAEELKKLLTDEEYEAARASTINAHYTSPDIVKAMWNAVAGFGITRGSVLEPASGTGNFVGLAPQQGKRFSMIELDSLTGRIAKVVYPKAHVQVKGFQEASVPVNYYDLAISNVPFSSYRPYDKKAKAQGIPSGLVLHDYFFAKSLVAVKPGGIIAFVTSSGTLDKGDRSFREYLNKNAKFIGAIRLPSDAFKKNAMTEVVTDIIFLQKPMPGETFTNPYFLKIADFKGVEVNQYFIDNPDKVIGKLGVGKGLYSGAEMTVKSQDDFAEKFAMAIDSLPKNIYKAEADRQIDTVAEEIDDHTKIKSNALVVKNGAVFQKVGDNLVKQDVRADDAKRIEGLIKIRDTVRDLLNAERTDSGNIEQLRKSLNSEYDTFVKKYGNINKDENIELMAEDPDYPLLASLEDVKKVGPRKFEYNKREIFRERINKPHQKPTSAKTADEALKISLGEYGDINMDYISSLLGMSANNIQKAMLDSGSVYRDPNGNKIVLKDEYLSGNVKRKLAEAEAAVEIDPSFAKNVEALRLVIPKDRTFDKIRVNIGMPWIKGETYNGFLRSLGLSGKVVLNTASGTWAVEKDMSRYGYYRSGVEEYGVANLSGEKIFELIMNGKPVKVTKTTYDEQGQERKVVDEEQTALAESKAEQIKEKFKTWFWADDTRRAEYEKIYNENWNHTVPRQWDGTHLVFPGMNDKGLPGKLRVPQLNAIWRGIINNRVMLAHSVGAGKTAIMTITAMESKRLGLANKSLIIAPKNTIPGWRSHINGLYPAAKVLIANEKNFNSKKLKAFLANVATGNWDIVVMSHDNYESMPVSPDAYKEFVQEEIDNLREAKEAAKQAGSRITVKNIETAIKNLEAKIESKLDQSKKLDLLYFEDLGIDALYVDEADLYKNLAYSTTKEKIKGMGTQAGSVRAMDMKMKTDILRRKNGKIVFATGTPISNSMVEAYTMMKYLQPEMLREQGINSFDAWANTFADPTTENEVDVTGERFKLVTRFKNFMNMSSLRTMIGETWDIQTQEMLIKAGVFKRGVNLPNIKGGGPQNIVLPRSKELVEYTKTLIDRAEAISKRKGKVQKGDDIMLTVMQDGIKAALDMRMIDPTLPADPDSKVEWTLRKLVEKHKEYSEIKGAQIVFIDNPAPDKKAKFNPQEYMKKKLISSGIPEKEIAFIHDFNTDNEKTALYERVNSGEVRILFGSTEKLGAGTNIQKRLSVLYHLGIPQAMRPRDITQREGRIDRPGNMNKEIEIYRLAQKGSLDTFRYQLLEAKHNTVEQFMRGDTDMIDMDEQSADPYEAMKALSSDNPLVKEKSDIDRSVKSLRALYNAYLGERTKASNIVKTMPGKIEQNQKEAEAYKTFKSNMPEKPTKETFTVNIKGSSFTEKKEALDAIYKVLTDIPIKSDAPVEIGSYLGYKLYAEKNILGDRVESTLSIKVSDNPSVFLRGKVSADPVGTFGSLDYGIFNDVDKYITLIEDRIKEDTKALNYAREVQAGKFNKQSELDSAVNRQKEIDALLKKDMSKQTVSEVEKNIAETTTDDDIKYANLGLAPQPKSTKMVNDDIQGMVQFSDPDVESRFRLAKGMSVEGLKSRIKTFLADMGARMTRTYPTLPNIPKYAEIRNLLSKQQINRSVANERAIRAIDAITAGFGPKKLDLFTRKVILEDLAREIEAGRAIPFGYSEYSEDGGVVTNVDMFNKDKANIDYLVSENPDVQEALRKRKALWEALQSDLVTNGILDEEQVKQDYFRHQVLDYARLKATMGTGGKLRTPTPGYAKRRMGSTADINTDYVQAEFEVMAQAMHDIETSKNIKKIEDSSLNIVSDLREQAKEQAKDSGEKIDWHTLIPEGYTTWQPKEGNVFYMANSVSDKVINAALERLDGTGIDPKDLKKVLALGTKRKEFVLPEDVATTLDNLYSNKNINAIAEGGKRLTTYWKRWILMNPRRAFKYNYQNFIGDFDAVVAGDPKILAKFSKAVSELNDTMLKGKPMTKEMKEFFERGGLSAQMTVNELPELRSLEVFQRLLDSSPAADFKRQLNVWQRYWQGVGTLTTYREAIFRYAAYLHYRDMFTKGGKVNYGASIKSEVDNISDPLDKAAKIATELLGDYANLTAFGKDMRESVIPFYSWLEINAKRYSRLTRNAFSEGWQKGIKTSATIAGVKGSLFLAKWMVRAAAMTGLMMLYNATMFPDEEEELNEYDKNRLHIILGRDKDGKVIILRGQTAFADILEWFGLDAAPTYWREYTEGKASFADLFGTIPYTDLPAFGLSPFSGKIGLHPAAMKMVRGINPLYKLPVETMTGKSLPAFDDRSWKVEDKTRNVVKALSLENEYDLVTGKPSRGYWKSVQEAFISKTDPEENAYRYIQGEKYKFLETVKGRGGSSDFYSPRSLLYREYRKALKLKDTGAVSRIRKQMSEQGVTERDLQQSLERSDPLSGMNREDKYEFINRYLTDRDRKVMLPRANKYYVDTFRRTP